MDPPVCGREEGRKGGLGGRKGSCVVEVRGKLDGRGCVGKVEKKKEAGSVGVFQGKSFIRSDSSRFDSLHNIVLFIRIMVV